MKNVLFLVLFGMFSLESSSLCFAAISVNDPLQILPQLRAKSLTPDFNSLFHVNDTATFDHYIESCEISCTDAGPDTLGGCTNACKIKPNVVTRSVLSMEDDKVVIYGKEDGFYEEISVDDIKTCNGSLVERVIANLDMHLNLQGVFTIEKFSTFELPLAEGTPRQRKVTAHSVWGSFALAGMASAFPVKVSFVPSAPGVGQVAMFSVLNTVYFRLKDF